MYQFRLNNLQDYNATNFETLIITCQHFAPLPAVMLCVVQPMIIVTRALDDMVRWALKKEQDKGFTTPQGLKLCHFYYKNIIKM